MTVRYVGHGKRMGKKKRAGMDSVVKYGDKSVLGGTTLSCEDNIKIDFQGI